MSGFYFKVGTKEVHEICFKLNRFTAGFNVTVDGNLVKKGIQVFIGKKEIKFDVGEKEKHKIWINWRAPVFGGVRRWKANVYIDDVLYNTYKI